MTPVSSRLDRLKTRTKNLVQTELETQTSLIRNHPDYSDSLDPFIKILQQTFFIEQFIEQSSKDI
ncbi:MAG: hypothetical protein KKH99_11820, partial [Proteobacteria bacterium]|nr:hypothetical protein [Pseudomonadota bacterium]